MSDSTDAVTGGADSAEGAYARGVAKITEVYAGDVVTMPEGTMAFNDVMMRSLFAEVWDRDILSIRDRRLLIMGVIAANGATDTWKIQAMASLKRGELSPDELRETLIMLAPYAGYPNVAPFIAECEGVIHAYNKAKKEAEAGTNDPEPEDSDADDEE